MPRPLVRLGTIADAEADAESGKLDRAFQQLSSASATRSCEQDSDAKQFPDDSYCFDGAHLSSFCRESRIGERARTVHVPMSLVAENLAGKVEFKICGARF